jgi:hypothetical protein
MDDIWGIWLRFVSRLMRRIERGYWGPRIPDGLTSEQVGALRWVADVTMQPPFFGQKVLADDASGIWIAADPWVFRLRPDGALTLVSFDGRSLWPSSSSDTGEFLAALAAAGTVGKDVNLARWLRNVALRCSLRDGRDGFERFVSQLLIGDSDRRNGESNTVEA